MNKGIRGLFCASAILLFVATAGATAIWDEEIDGDLSGDPSTPTVLAFDLGSNKIIGNVGSLNDLRDFFTFKIDANQVLARINLVYFINVSVGGTQSEAIHVINIGVEGIIPTVDNAGDFLGGDHLTALPSGTDLLALLATAPFTGTGFDAPLGEGSYSYLLQQTGPMVTGYALDFVVTAVPVPAAVWLLGSALTGLFGLRRRTRTA